MLDLNFVRDHLELVEERLRQRGADPAELLGNFREIDQDRRRAFVPNPDRRANAVSGVLRDQVAAQRCGTRPARSCPSSRRPAGRLRASVLPASLIRRRGVGHAGSNSLTCLVSGCYISCFYARFEFCP